MTDEERQKLVGQKTPSDHSLGLAAQAWCEPETSHKEMDEALCTAFARILDRALAQSNTEPVTMRALLREARPYVASAKGDDTETHNFVDGLLRDIDAALAQSNAEPVAWRVKDFGDDWILCYSREWAEKQAESAGNLIQPLYAAPPCPDASALNEKADLFDNAVEAGRNAGWDMGIYTPKSLIKTLNSELVRLHAIVERSGIRPDASAGLIEAAEWLEQRAPACYAATTAREWATELRKEAAIRARAADRSGK